MKVVKGKYIRLTEQELNSLIKEAVQRELQMIMEYAEPRNKFVNRCANLFNQIFENWILCHYCSLVNEDINQCKNHWRNELLTHFGNIINSTIKGKDDFDVRKKAIIEGFDKSDAYGDHKIFNKKMVIKFYKEKYKPNPSILEQCFTDFDNNLENIVNLLANSDSESIIEYVENI